MAIERARAFVVKSEDLSSISGTHMVKMKRTDSHESSSDLLKHTMAYVHM